MSSASSALQTATPGYLGSERSDVEVVVYPQGQDAPISFTYTQAAGTYPMAGRTERDASPSVISVQLSKSLGVAGTFSVTLKVPPGAQALLSTLSDDDWVDISLVRLGRKTHVLRGLIDEIRRNVSVVGQGTQVSTWTVAGRDFQKVYEQSSTYLSLYAAEASAGALAYKWYLANSTGSVAATVQYFLQRWISITQSVGRNLWNAPPNMPGMPTDFPSAVVADVAGYTDGPPRRTVATSLLDPDGSVWDMAQQWSDPAFCELYTELRPKSASAAQTLDSGGTAQVTPADTEMAYVVRDRPFILVDPLLAQAGYSTGLISPWFNLPTVTLPATHLAASDVGRNGQERFNMFVVSPLLSMDEQAQFTNTNPPLLHRPDIAVHGLRRYDVVTRYTAGQNDHGQVVSAYDVSDRLRRVARDYHCMNPYWLNGTLAFGRGVPQLRCGMRLRIARRTESDQETYYVEGVSHSFTPTFGLRTSVAVTRGYIGSDANIVSTMQTVSAGYALAALGRGR